MKQQKKEKPQKGGKEKEKEETKKEKEFKEEKKFEYHNINNCESVFIYCTGPNQNITLNLTPKEVNIKHKIFESLKFKDKISQCSR